MSNTVSDTMSNMMCNVALDSMPMRSTTRKSNRERVVRHEELVERLRPAVEGMLEGGTSYTELSVERLADAAGISRSGFYTYFPDKIALLEDLTTRLITEISDAGVAAWRLPDNAGRAAFGAQILAFFQAYRPHAALFDAIIETSAYDTGIRTQYEAMVAESTEHLVAHIRAGQKTGTIRAGLDAARTAPWISWMAERGLQQILRRSTDDEVGEQADALAEIVWHILYEGYRTR